MQVFNEALAFWLYLNGVALAGLCLWSLARAFLSSRPAASGRRRGKLVALASLCGFVALFAYLDSTSLVEPTVTLNALGKAVTLVLAVCAPKLVAFACRFAGGFQHSEQHA